MASTTGLESELSIKERTGFFDLPIELRQMIYDEFLPLHSNVHVGAVQHDDNHNLCAAHPQLAIEMRDWESERLKWVCFWVTSTPWCVPAHFRLDKLQRALIFLPHYESIAQLRTMRNNMELLVKWLSSRATDLPRLTVRFHDTTEPQFGTPAWFHSGGLIARPDQYWCCSFTSHQGSRSTVLRSMNGIYDTRSRFEYLLRPLVDLSKCQRLDITLLNKVFDRNHWRLRMTHSQIDNLIPLKYQKLDMDYMWTFAETLEAWVEGRISKELAFGKRWKRYLSAVRLRGLRETRESTRHLLTRIEKTERG